MEFLSYAQNYEDVILWRALADIEKGFYVDIGAADPVELSVTRAFYDRGWSGINVEPLDEYFEKLNEDRPRDINLKIAIGREAGVRTLHTIRETGLSTFDSDIAERHKSAGWESKQTIVPVLTLAKVLEDCAPPTVHFLKIDVEGAEREVLEGATFGRIRPWIILVEAKEPLSTADTRETWERLVTAQGYEFAYFDGLNCFYVADEVSHLKERLAVPPNVFDEFIRRSEYLVRSKVGVLEGDLSGLRARATGLERAIHERTQEIFNLRNEITDLRNEISNLRSGLVKEQEDRIQFQNRSQALERELATPIAMLAFKRLRNLGDRITGGGIRALTRKTLRTAVTRVMQQRQLMAAARTILKPFPKLTTSLHNAATPAPALPAASDLGDESEILAGLPASARKTYRTLQSLIPLGEGAEQSK